MAFDISTAQPVEDKPSNGFDISTAKAVEEPQSKLLSNETIPGQSKSPLSVLKRAKLAFSDDAGKENALKEDFAIVQRLPNGKFAVGNTPEDIRPIDPEGFLNDFAGDMADIAGEVPIILGQVGGAAIGTLAGPAGTVVGGGVGSASGEALKQGIGKALGVRESNKQKDAVDIAIAGAFGTLGEGVAKAIPMAKNGISNVVKKALDKSVSKSGAPSKTLQGLGKLFKVTAAVNPDDVVVAGTYGFDNTLQAKYMNPEHSRELMNQFVGGVLDKDKALGEAVNEGKKWAVRNYGKKQVEGAVEVGQKLLSEMSDPSVGMFDSLGRLDRAAFVDPKDYRAVKNLTDLFFNKSKDVPGKIIPKNLTVKEVIDFKDRARPLLNSYFKSQGKNPTAERAIASYLDDITGATAKTTTGGAGGLTDDALRNNPYVNSNKAFSEWKKDLGLLKANGLDVSDLKKLRATQRGGKVVSQSMENFFERFKVKNSSTEEIFKIVSEKIPVRFPGGGVNGAVGTLADELNKFNAAQGFRGANPNMLRMTAIAGMVGFSMANDDPLGTLKKLGIGVALGTPAGARTILRGASKVKNTLGKSTIKSAAKKSTSKVKSKLSGSVISSLLRQKESRDRK